MSASAEATAREIAAAIQVGRMTICRRAARETWPCREVPAPGRPKRLYLVESLPIEIRRALDPQRTEEVRAPGTTLPSSSAQRPLNAPSTAVEGVDTVAENVPPEDPLARRWERLPEERRQRAGAKLALLDEAIAIAAAEGVSMRAACERIAAAEESRWSAATLLAAWRKTRKLPRHRLALALADRWTGCNRFADCDPAAWQAFKADYLRAEAPPLAMCGRTLRRLAGANGWTVPASDRALLRRLRNEVSPQAITLARQGPEALGRMRPAQIRDREALFAMEIVCADGHRFDVLVAWPDGTTGRPMLVCWQDVRSGKVLGWRIGREETAHAYRLSMADTLWKYGAPDHAIVDNGRGIAADALTGGSPTRFRRGVRPEDPIGLLTELVGKDGIHWTKPYSGQSKPVERSFRDMASDIAKDIRLAGAYTGKDTVSKPHNYGSKAVPLADFRQVAADGIAQHNARRGRSGLGMDGRSCDEVFEAARAGREPRKLAPSQLARWLLAADGVVARASDGAVTLHKTRYWCPELASELAGKAKAARHVVVRYDPEDLARPVQVEHPDGRVIGRAGAQGAVAYLDREAAKAHERAKAAARKATKAELAAHRAVKAAAVGAMLGEVAGEAPADGEEAPLSLVDELLASVAPEEPDETDAMRRQLDAGILDWADRQMAAEGGADA